MINQFRNLILIVSGGIIAFVFMLGLFFSRKITGPIIELRNTVIKIGQGKLGTKIKVKSSDETGELALAFSQMTADLRKSRVRLEESRVKLEEYSKGLEKQVANRTKELKENVDELEKFNKLAVGRELKMVELKKEIKELKKEIEKPK